jgi:hypothetical protein
MQNIKQTSKTLNGLRTTIFTEIDKLRRGRRDRQDVAVINAISNAAGRIISSVRVDLEYAKLVGKPVNDPKASLKSGKKSTRSKN